jgi:hypothetical protein
MASVSLRPTDVDVFGRAVVVGCVGGGVPGVKPGGRGGAAIAPGDCGELGATAVIVGTAEVVDAAVVGTTVVVVGAVVVGDAAVVAAAEVVIGTADTVDGAADVVVGTADVVVGATVDVGATVVGATVVGAMVDVGGAATETRCGSALEPWVAELDGTYVAEYS